MVSRNGLGWWFDNVSGQKNVWLEVVWQTDGQNGLKGGAFVDDVLLTKMKK